MSILVMKFMPATGTSHKICLLRELTAEEPDSYITSGCSPLWMHNTFPWDDFKLSYTRKETIASVPGVHLSVFQQIAIDKINLHLRTHPVY